MSRQALLQWVNTTLSEKYKKIEELGSGVAYCQLLESIYPNTVGMRKVKTNTKLELDHMHNLRLLQRALLNLKIDKNIHIERLAKCTFQDNFDFLSWFKRFYEQHSNNKENNDSSNKVTSSVEKVKPYRRALSATNLKSSGSARKKLTPKALTPQGTGQTTVRRKSLSANGLNQSSSEKEAPISPSSLQVLKETYDDLKEKIKAVEKEKDFYFNRLRQVEDLCNGDNQTEWSQKVLRKLFSISEDSLES